jgi:hypothetical protein
MEEPVTQNEKEMPEKKLYQKPEVRFEKVFEVMALVCGKVSATQLSCHASRKTS